MKHGKKYVDGAKLIDRSQLYDTHEALGPLLSRLVQQSLTKPLKSM